MKYLISDILFDEKLISYWEKCNIVDFWKKKECGIFLSSNENITFPFKFFRQGKINKEEILIQITQIVSKIKHVYIILLPHKMTYLFANH